MTLHIQISTEDDFIHSIVYLSWFNHFGNIWRWVDYTLKVINFYFISFSTLFFFPINLIGITSIHTTTPSVRTSTTPSFMLSNPFTGSRNGIQVPYFRVGLVYVDFIYKAWHVGIIKTRWLVFILIGCIELLKLFKQVSNICHYPFNTSGYCPDIVLSFFIKMTTLVKSDVINTFKSNIDNVHLRNHGVRNTYEMALTRDHYVFTILSRLLYIFNLLLVNDTLNPIPSSYSWNSS